MRNTEIIFHEKYQKHPILYPALISIGAGICFYIVMFLMGPSYETNDDWSIARQLSNKGDIASFLNPLLSQIFRFLYGHFSAMPWWSLFSLSCGSILLTVLIYFILRQKKMKFHWFFVALLFSVVWICCAKYINFTRTAVVFGISGNLLLLQCILDRGGRKAVFFTEAFVGILLLMIGLMVRFQGALITIPFFFLTIVFFCFFSHKEFSFSMIVKNFRKFSPAIFFVCMAIFVVQTISIVYFNNHSEWKTYQEYNYTRGLIQDYAGNYPNWREGVSEYKDLGFEKGDSDMFLYGWFSEDTDVYSKDVLDSMVSLYDWKDTVKSSIISFFQICIKNIPFGILFLFASILIFQYRNKKIIFITALNILMCFAIILYFAVLGRIQLRVVDSIFLCGIVNLFILINFAKPLCEKIRQPRKIHLGKIADGKEVWKSQVPLGTVLLAVLCLVISFSIGGKDILTMRMPSFFDNADSLVRARTDFINDTKERIYIVPTLSDNWNLSYGIWEPIPYDYCSNLFFLGGWEARTPTNVSALKDLGIENPAKSLTEDNRIYSLFDDNVYSFLKRHYGAELTCSIVDGFATAGGTSIVKYTLPIRVAERNAQSEDYFNEILFKKQKDSGLWLLEVNGAAAFENVYCNVVSKGKVYTYALEYDEDVTSYRAYLYDLKKRYKQGIDDMYLIGTVDGTSYEYLGSIEKMIRIEDGKRQYDKE